MERHEASPRLWSFRSPDEAASRRRPAPKFPGSKRPRYKFLLLGLDWLAIVWAAVISLTIEQEKGGAGGIMDLPGLLFVLAVSSLTLFVFQVCRLYKVHILLSLRTQIKQLAKAFVYVALCLAPAVMLMHWSGPLRVSLWVLLLYPVAALFLTAAARLLVFRPAFIMATRSGLYNRTVLIVGAGETGRRLAGTLMKNRSYGLRVVGFLDDETRVGSTVLPGVRIMGKVPDVFHIVAQHRIDEVVICVENWPEGDLLDLLEFCAMTRALVTVASSVYDLLPMELFREAYGDVAVIGVHNYVAAAYGGVPAMKRAGDTVLAALGLLVHLPLFAVIALAIKASSPGPIFFKQVRIGKNGRPFDFYKFRSMRLGSDDTTREEKYARLIKGEWEGDGSSPAPLKIVDENRITPIGAFLRRTSLDELPQLFNVLKGDMSLVGPRPCLPYEWKYYDEWHKKRLSVTPGCTGMWQVLGRSEVGFEDMVVLDLFYSHNLSFHLDIWLILKTIPVMVLGKGGK